MRLLNGLPSKAGSVVRPTVQHRLTNFPATIRRRFCLLAIKAPHISLAADRTWSTSREVSLFHRGLPPPAWSSSPCCSLTLSHR